MDNIRKFWQTYGLIFPQTSIFLLFLVLPMVAIAVVSFWEFNGYAMTPAFTLENYRSILSSQVTLGTYLNTFKYVGWVWFICMAIAFPVAYFLSFCIQSNSVRILLFLVCTIPFWTSNIIRSISWIPLLGREGLVNQLLLNLHLVREPVEWLLYSDFAIVLGMVHLYNIFAIAPIFNSMIRIDRDLITAASDLGASGFAILKEIILPLTAPGIAIGSIFVVTLTMGEYVTVRLMGGGQAASIGKLINTQIGSLQYPLAAANATILLVITLTMVVSILRAVDIRKEL
ncbi:ABC transporter permease [Roseofilum sp. BLCC_M143]|uniref:ABC transporter permease n=1 Tax=Roseofilum casamattae BLCC-M143 TaxID=3022442 RepID=A0ABT7BV57_9CYAN|nr:ABC transporter permease [Roseofilum casamattae]MDJ1182168.1 ABC transporter permease [Roseofilum casamattae BLCC-M143]